MDWVEGAGCGEMLASDTLSSPVDGIGISDRHSEA
jgi:hypothetical protein